MDTSVYLYDTMPMQPVLSVRPLQQNDIPQIADYWHLSEPGFMQGMGVDLSKMPSRSVLEEMLGAQLQQSFRQKESYALIWEKDSAAIGHSNVNKIIFGEEAFMHLHLWQQEHRRNGIGISMLQQTLPYFFNDLELQFLYCEPYALNPAPNRTLARAGFKFVKEYVTTPGYLNFEQPVNRWVLTRKRFMELYHQ